MNYLTSAFAMAGALFLGAACSSSETGGDDELRDPPDGPAEVESNLTTSEKNAICNAIPAPRAWTEAETLRLTNEVVTRFSALKRTNDALITKRGVGSFVGARTNAAKMLDSGDFDGLARILAPKLKAGFNANQVAHELKGTSCIGRVYAVMRESYAALGRASEWAAIEKCGRAWDSDGLHVQAALMRNGWKSPAVAFVTDSKKLPGSAEEQAVHRDLLTGIVKGSYFGLPLSKSLVIKDFLPSPGSSTVKNDTGFLALGRSKYLSVGTFRAAYHVPFVIPAAFIPDEFASSAGARKAEWLAAKAKGEPFIMESHSLRMPWDPTNFEIRPLRFAIEETMSENIIYATGTALFPPFSEMRP